MIRVITLLLSSLFVLTSANAQMGGRGGDRQPPVPDVDEETLIYGLPAGWQPYGKTSDTKVENYFFPEDQSPSDWQEAIHVERYLDTQGVTESNQVFTLRTGERSECVERNIESLKQEPENGYSMSLWMDSCTSADSSVMMSLSKVILGNEQLYTVSKAWKFEPNQAQMTRWLNFLNQIYVCDPNTGANECVPPYAPAGRRGMGR